MKKIVLSLAVLSFMMVIGCGKTDKITESKTVLTGLSSEYEALVGGLTKAVSANDVAASLNKFSASAGPLMLKAKEIEKKYPEIRFSDLKNPPKELESEFKKLDSFNKQFMNSKITAVIGKYAADPAVTKALNGVVEKLSIK